MQTFPDNFFDSEVTDIPYGWNFMGEAWDYNIPPVEDFQEQYRVLKPGAYAVVLCGTRTQHKAASNLETAGFEIVDVGAWVYGQGFPKSKSKLKPAMELWTLAQKPIAERNLSENIRVWGTGGLNIDACRVHLNKVLDASQLRTMHRSQRQDSGWGMNTQSADMPQVVNPAGRFPANLIHDGSPEVFSLFPNTKSGSMKAGTQRKTSLGRGGYHGDFPDTATLTDTYGDSGSAARFFYCAKASQKERSEGLIEKNKHPTIKPIALGEYLCRLVTPAGGISVDPYCGTGSISIGAMKAGLHYVAIDFDDASCNIARDRLKYYKKKCK